MQQCKIHQTVFVQRAGGVSKTTGKQYGPFMCCPTKNADGTYCKEKPAVQQVPQAPANPSFQASVVLGAITAKLDTVILMLKGMQAPVSPIGIPFPTAGTGYPQNTSNGVAVEADDSSIPF